MTRERLSIWRNLCLHFFLISTRVLFFNQSTENKVLVPNIESALHNHELSLEI